MLSLRAAALSLAVLALAAGVAGAGAATRPQAPPLSGTTLDGKRLSLASLRGRPVLVNVWSSW